MANADDSDSTHRIPVRIVSDGDDPEPAPAPPVDSGTAAEDPVIVAVGDDDDDDESAADVVTVELEEETVPRAQLLEFGRERLRLEKELRELQADAYQSKAKVRELEQSLQEQEELGARRQAEFQNFRRRLERERESALRYANADLLEALLPVLDNFHRAMSQPPSPESTVDFYKGIELIHKQFTDVLAQVELIPTEAVGLPFDPNFHEAVTRKETSSVPPDHVTSVLRRGYTYRDRLMRPALVEVAVAPPEASADTSVQAVVPTSGAGEIDADEAPARPQAAEAAESAPSSTEFGPASTDETDGSSKE